MATIVLSAVGLSAGSALGGSILGLSTAVIGRAVGATLGRVIDQRIMGSGSEVVESGKVDRFRLTGASEGTPIAQVYGRIRVSGQVIWATRFQEQVSETGGGKGAPPKPTVREFSYSVSVAIALCRGEISGIGRVWADGQEVGADALNMRVYSGADDQMPDPKIEAVEGAGSAPAYRGVAYVVFEDLDLGSYGNRVPQFSFEVLRPALKLPDIAPELSEAVRAIALMPGTGEYALATTPVHFEIGPGENRSANVNSPSGKTDLLTSLDALQSELPNCAAASLIVSWFGDDLRCETCTLQPKVEQKLQDGVGMPWRVSGVDRASAVEIAQEDGRPVYGGTPSDQSVIEAIHAMQDVGKAVTFYPFILMDQLAGNALVDPWTGADDQPALPWRGRITLSVAPGRSGSPDTTAAAEAEVAAFIGTAEVDDFTQTADGVAYSGPAEWSYRRFVLHNAHLCSVAGGVDAFCIGSEMRSLTQIRGADGRFPAVEALMQLAADVRGILGPDCRIGYAADWSEYFGYHPQDGSGDVIFHLDPLWAHPDIDFVGIDNYMPLSDWRDGDDHVDANWGSIHNLDYLRANIFGGEGYDWYYRSPEAEEAQLRTPITGDPDYDAWVYRYKDLKSWWSHPHSDRVDGARGNIYPIHGALAEKYTVKVPSVATDGFSSDDFGYPATRVEHINQQPVYIKYSSFVEGELYTLRVRAKSNNGATQTTHLSYNDGARYLQDITLGPDWQEYTMTFLATKTEIFVFPSDPRFGGNATDILISRVSLEAASATTQWVPESKPIWFTELGCAAIDKGTNQPNKFLDPKSSESNLPKYSNGRRDDFVQMQYLRAMTSFYSETANNPVSAIYGEAMVDMARAHVWAWDARPYPFFPGNTELWSDGGNYARGHWLNGRGSGRSLAGVVAEICEASGVSAYEVSQLYGVVRGYASGDVDSGRAALQPLMLAYGFDAVERNGVLVFRSRNGRAGFEVDLDRLAVSTEAETDLLTVRAPVADVAGRLRLSFVEADGDFATRAEEAVFPDEATRSVAASEVPLVLTRTEARGIVERWLAEARVARDTAKFALPPSQLAVRAGDVVRLPHGQGLADYRIDRVEQAEFQMLEAVRVEPEIYVPSDAVEVATRPKSFVPPVPVYPLFLDLPLLRGDEVEHAPHIAVSARPWPGSVAVYGAPSDDGYQLNRLLAASAIVGATQTPMFAAKSGVLDRGEVLRVKLISGALSSASLGEILNGANVAAIGDGSAANWELFQFQDAELVAPRTFDLSGRLRGQAGTDGTMPDVWPQGSMFVLLNSAVQQIDLSLSSRGLARHYRIGPAQRSYDDPSYVHLVEAFDGVGLRPYAPAHLRATEDGGDLRVDWVRRTRIDGDSWQSVEVPLGEDSESYLVRVLQNGALIRETVVGTPSWTYSSSQRASDGLSGAYQIDVAQLSGRFGPGPFRRIPINE